MNLSKQDKEQIIQLRLAYLEIINDYARKPGTFEACVTLLDKVSKIMLTVSDIQLNYAKEIADNLDGKGCGLFKKIKAAKQTYDFKNIKAEVTKLLYNKDVIRKIKSIHENSPIQAFNTHIQHNESENYTNGFFSRTVENANTYTIIFSDNYKLSWNAYKDTEKAAARVEFENKINELSHRPRLG